MKIESFKLNHHPYIVTLFGYVYTNLTDAIPIGILMEFMSGGNLYDRKRAPMLIFLNKFLDILDLAATGKYPTSPYLKNTWAKQIALGLNFMHSRKMMHRDLKPDKYVSPFYYNYKSITAFYFVKIGWLQK